MSAESSLVAGRLFDGENELGGTRVDIGRNGLISELAPEQGYPGREETTLTPTFVDIHTHGARGHDVMFATVAELSVVGRFLATCGVGHYLPTTVTAGVDITLFALERLADAVEQGAQPLEAQPLGIHLEGPFLSHGKRGVHPAEHLQPPSVELFHRFQQAARGHIVLLTLAPELPGAVDLIRYAAAGGVRVSLGHTDASAAATLAAIEAGAGSATHTFNAMRALDHREPGVLGTVLDDDRLFAELICDGIHVAPPLVRLWLKAKGPDRILLVTDAMAATGNGDGEALLGGLPVTVKHGRALLTGDLAAGKETLAGSVLTMNAALENLRRYTGTDLATAVRGASTNPARLLGMADLGCIRAGLPANLNRFDGAGRLVATYLRGAEVSPGLG